jgi:uncharacterized protein (TIGR03083 family)
MSKPTPSTTDPVQVYLGAAATFARVVNHIDPSSWRAPGLGAWDLRALVGHTSRALVTVLNYLDQPAEAEDLESPQQYYVVVAQLGATNAAAIVERGRRAGRDLGDDPPAAVRALIERVTAKLKHADPDALVQTIGGGMRIRHYLPTRTFELVVHSLDIIAVTGLRAALAPDALAHATRLATDIAIELGQGPTVLQALTGRARLPHGFSVV